MNFRIVASSPRNPGNLIVQERGGGLHAFVAATGTISHGQLHADFYHALLRSANWRHVEDDNWYSLEDLKRSFARPEREVVTLASARSAS